MDMSNIALEAPIACLAARITISEVNGRKIRNNEPTIPTTKVPTFKMSLKSIVTEQFVDGNTAATNPKKPKRPCNTLPLVVSSVL